MAHKSLLVSKPNGEQRMVSVLDTTTVKEIVQQFLKDEVHGRQATLIQGVTLLEPDMTVNQAGLEDGNEICLVWIDPFVEMIRWTGGRMGKDLYVRIPPEATSIDAGAFRGCKALVNIVIPNSVMSIGAWAFADCTSLTEVEMSHSVASIGDRAFHGCSSLTQVEIPESATRIEQGHLPSAVP